MLQSINATLDLCANLQPNSRLWQMTGMQGQAGFGASSFAMPAALPANGGLRPSMTGMIVMTKRQDKAGGTGGFDPRMERTIGVHAAHYQYQISTDRLLGNFNKLNIGSHSRPSGGPPQKASAPPGRRGADPGGGPTAS